jgi:hypothetical protein
MKTSGVLILVFVAIIVIIGGVLLLTNMNNPNIVGQTSIKIAQNSTMDTNPTNTQIPMANLITNNRASGLSYLN